MFKLFSGKEIAKEIENISNRRFFDKTKESQALKIVEDVRFLRDQALIQYTKQFDQVELDPSSIKIQHDAIEKAYQSVDRDFIEIIKELGENITEFHKNQVEKEWFMQKEEDAVMGMRHIPLDSVGIYVPGGRAAYPSTVLMNAIPAKVAGVERIALVSPPPISPFILVAAAELNISEIYQVGGAQAIAALAFGTESIPRVDKIVGPGNQYVTIAKKIVSYQVGIDSLAGPSDIMIIADEDSEAPYIAADLLSQCEHDPDAMAILITDSERVAKEVQKELDKQFVKLKRKEIIKESAEKNGRIFIVEKLSQAAQIANTIAPEHLEILVSPPQKILEKIRHAGAVFLGPYSPVALGDYGAGPNHVLPTNGTARFSSPLGVYDFIKKQSVLGYTKGALSKIKKNLVKMADVEGLDAHKRSIEIRFS